MGLDRALVPRCQLMNSPIRFNFVTYWRFVHFFMGQDPSSIGTIEPETEEKRSFFLRTLCSVVRVDFVAFVKAPECVITNISRRSQATILPKTLSHTKVVSQTDGEPSLHPLFLQPLGPFRLHPAEFVPPTMGSRLRNTLLRADLLDRRPAIKFRVCFTQPPNNLPACSSRLSSRVPAGPLGALETLVPPGTIFWGADQPSSPVRRDDKVFHSHRTHLLVLYSQDILKSSSGRVCY